jgi:hypothetical protein
LIWLLIQTGSQNFDRPGKTRMSSSRPGMA